MSRTLRTKLRTPYVLEDLWPAILAKNELKNFGSGLDQNHDLILGALSKVGDEKTLTFYLTLRPIRMEELYVVAGCDIYWKSKSGVSRLGILHMNMLLTHLGKKEVSGLGVSDENGYFVSSPKAIEVLLREYARLAKFYGGEPIFTYYLTN